MKPVSLITLLLFLGGVAWALTRSEPSVRIIQSGYYSVMRPFLSGGSAMETKIRSFDDELEHSRVLKAELDIAEAELVRMRMEIAQLKDLEQENVQMRAALNFQKRTSFSVTAAKIIRRKPSNWWETAHIDRGKDHGIRAQLPVIAAEGLVGKVDRPNSDSSTVILLTDEACQVSAKVLGNGVAQEVGILSGQRAQNGENPMLRLKYLSRETNVKPGQLVVSTGRGKLFPKDVALGTVISIERGSINAEALVKPAVDFATVHTVFVLTNPSESDSTK